MKHWFTTVVAGENEEGVQYTVCTQKFYIDQERFLVDLSGLFANAGVGLAGAPLCAFIAKNSVGMVDEKGVRRPMAPVVQASQILMSALAAGHGEKVNVQDAVAYVTHLQNVLAKNAMRAYAMEAAKINAVPPDADGSQGDDGV